MSGRTPWFFQIHHWICLLTMIFSIMNKDELGGGVTLWNAEIILLVGGSAFTTTYSVHGFKRQTLWEARVLLGPVLREPPNHKRL